MQISFDIAQEIINHLNKRLNDVLVKGPTYPIIGPSKGHKIWWASISPIRSDGGWSIGDIYFDNKIIISCVYNLPIVVDYSDPDFFSTIIDAIQNRHN